ncbi:uncharacterized protein PHALS_09745 [Plasmopara halstedii]|uniref:Uncharacterized protein n=1 Tax=Plasmopara halstedii TaxID=4781 RepID=A0A0P1AF19_PLAHL|nr:uncharacterized protein PHALS_09745 [Plasmopara halstedii]CEG39502.1 hypothetical protein PHALS_09745 [Plasmopara halstedii]|eukprot:XP_024575871.1 hypothetical protein PHALS_09745 [Plasmopara halstedii]
MTVEECAAMFDAVSMREAFWFRFALVPRTAEHLEQSLLVMHCIVSIVVQTWSTITIPILLNEILAKKNSGY